MGKVLIVVLLFLMPTTSALTGEDYTGTYMIEAFSFISNKKPTI
jgi:hypothetical protein